MSQTDIIMAMLKSGWVSPLTATVKLGYVNFGARMTEIRKRTKKMTDIYLQSRDATKNGKKYREHRIFEVKK